MSPCNYCAACDEQPALPSPECCCSTCEVMSGTGTWVETPEAAAIEAATYAWWEERGWL